MMRRKNLERAVILGLLLSTGVYGNVFATEVTTNEFISGKYQNGDAVDGVIVDNNTIVVSKDIIVNGIPNQSDETENFNQNKTINVEKDVNVTFNNLYLNMQNITGKGNIVINANNSAQFVNPIYVGGNIQANSLTLNTNYGDGIYLYEHDLTLDVEHLTINATDNGFLQETSEEGPNGGNIPLTTPTTTTINNTQSINVNSSGSWAFHNNSQAGVLNNVYMCSDKENSIINLMGANGYSHTSAGESILKADNINIGAWSTYGVYAGSGGTLEIEAKENVFIGDKFIEEQRIGDYATQAAHIAAGTMLITAKEGNVTIIGNEGVFTDRRNDGTATITAGQNNYIYAGTNTLQAAGGNITVSGQNNYIKADTDVRSSEFDFEYGDRLAISPENSSITTVTATGENGLNDIRGAVSVAKGTSTVNITSDNNYIASEYKQVTAGSEDERNIVSAVYVKEKGAVVNINSSDEKGINVIQSYAEDSDSEHTIWAQQGGEVNITGRTIVNAHNANINTDGTAGNAYGVAIAAGTGEISGLTEIPEVENRSTVKLDYIGESQITGDIVSGYGGLINIGKNLLTRSNASGSLIFQGNALAGNGGILDLNLGTGGEWYGRADDYGDAGTESDDGSHQSFYNPAFSNKILESGNVTLNMGDNAKWYVQGQSWITNINTKDNALIDLTNVGEGYENYKSHALTVRNLNGDANIKMDLNGDRSQSDMLYIGQGKGEYNIELANLVRVDDMYANLDNDTKFSGLRFATVGKGSDVHFNVTAKGQGFNNVVYTVDTDVYNSDESKHENNAYNGENMSQEKPGNSLVEDLLNGNQNTESASAATLAANDVMLLAAETEPVNDNETQHLNYKLVDMKADGFTDAGRTMLNMSRANYSNAIYMDRLNKRLGEARYINDDPEEDEGMWVRIRHDRIGKEDAFRSQNTMYELGYDKRQECDNGKRRVGFAVDYMHGDTGYNDIAGKGEIDRYGLWLYDTWTGNKGHYADYVAKWGHLQNDFEVYNMGDNQKVTGDYSNNVFSVSAEYGRKKDMGNDWYFEPQAQLQLARVTGANYTTSQGTKVSVDGINSLIGRAGFRIGKDFGEEKQSTLYFKADVLHEFLGDQTIRALDGTTNGWQTVDYENQGTWYDIGIGYAAMLSQSTYAFVDLEQSFGNDNDDTYQINAGVRWTF